MIIAIFVKPEYGTELNLRETAVMFKRTKTASHNLSSEEHANEQLDADLNPLSRRFPLGDDTPTVKLNTHQVTEQKHMSEDAETRIFVDSDESKTGTHIDKMADPPVGILVVVDGPGKGNIIEFGYGMNSIGRNETERVSLDFGDQRISRQKHALITYDGKSRRFFVQHGGGANLTYVGDEPVLTPQLIKERDLIKLGNTTLMFLPLCNTDFDWL